MGILESELRLLLSLVLFQLHCGYKNKCFIALSWALHNIISMADSGETM